MSHWEPVLVDLVRYRGGSLLRYATLLCGNQRDAEDLLQDALINVFKVMRRPQGSGDLTVVDHAEAYVRRTVLNLYLDRYRRRRRLASVRHLLGGADSTAGPDQASPERLDLDVALSALPPKQRACVLLRYFADLTVEQITDDLGVTTGTVKRHLHDATVNLHGSVALSRREDGS